MKQGERTITVDIILSSREDQKSWEGGSKERPMNNEGGTRRQLTGQSRAATA